MRIISLLNWVRSSQNTINFIAMRKKIIVVYSRYNIPDQLSEEQLEFLKQLDQEIAEQAGVPVIPVNDPLQADHPVIPLMRSEGLLRQKL